MIEGLLSHRSIRKYQERPVSPDLLNQILEAGARSATPAEMQFYSFILIDRPEVLKQMNCPAPLALVACIDLYRHNRWMQLRGADPLDGNAPDLLFCFWDVALAAQNIIVAAESLGLGTIVGIRDFTGILDTPEGVYPAAMIGLGYPDESPELRSRFPLAAIVHRDAYQVPSDDDVATWYGFLDRKWKEPLAERFSTKAGAPCKNYAEVLSALLTLETGWIANNLRRTGFTVAETAEIS